MASEPVLLILDEDNSANLADEWLSFLKQDGVQSPVSPGASVTTGGPPSSFACKNARFWGLEFGTASNDDNLGVKDYNVGESIVLSLSKPSTDVKNPDPETPNITTILGSLGMVQDSDNKWASGGIIDNIISTLLDSLTKLKIDRSTGQRNVMWLTPGQTLRIDTALVLESTSQNQKTLDTIITSVSNEFDVHPQTPISGLKVFLQRTSYGIHSTDAANQFVWDVASTFRLSFRLTVGSLWFWVVYEPSAVRFSITPNADVVGSPNLMPQLSGLAIPGLDEKTITPVFNGVLKNIALLNLSAGKSSGSPVWWSVKLALTWGRSDSVTANPVQIYLSYDSRMKTFEGGLITASFYASAADRLLATYLPGVDIDQPAGIVVPAAWNLMQLCGETDTLPNGLPNSLALADLDYYMGSPSSLALRAKLVYIKPPDSPGAHHVPMPFTWDEIDIELYKGSGSVFGFRAGTYVTLSDPKSVIPSAHIGINISYDSTGPSYQLMGYVDDLSLGLLWSFFDSDVRSSILETLGKLNISTLKMLYTYQAGLASSFCFSATVELGPIELRMFYQYTSKQAGTATAAKKLIPPDGPAPRTVASDKPDWFLEFDLGASSPDADVGTILSAFSDDVAGVLPSFVSEIKIPTAGVEQRSPVSIKVAKQTSGTNTRLLVVLRIAIKGFTLTFIQVGQAPKQTKRMLRFSVSKIPLIEKIPLLDTLPQPFDKLEYYWVNGPQGFLRSEVEALNTELLDGEDTLLYKATSGPVRDLNTGAPAAGPPPDVEVIRSGHHFAVTQNGAIVIDHLFNATPKPAPTISSANLSTPTPHALVASNPMATQPNTSAPSKGPVALTNGPLTISACTLQYKESSDGESKILSIVIDATFRMGPMSFSLLGFSIGIPLDKFHLDNLAGLADDVVVSLNGLALSFNKPPILIAGGFEHKIVPDGEVYMGGVGIGFPPYTFIGIGSYKKLAGYKSVFLYAKLDGPIITLEFATIEGVRLGFGYNSVVRPPDVNNITSFPFLNDSGASGAGNDPMALLKSLVENPKDQPWVTAKQDALWFAAGMTITAFDILSVTAVAMFSFRDSGVVMSLYANAIAQMPPGVHDTSMMIVYVEIGMVAEMNFVDGYFRVEASLAPSSFLLVPQCRIYGGFSLIYWFPPNEHFGDWVFTIGGYHKNYKPPPWYPVPRRLGISFNIGIINITGEAYFAITPKVAMGGAMLHASLSFGPIHAWFDAAMDALVNFHPLHYVADFSCSIGVSFNIDVWFIHIHVSASVGAWVHIEGPELGGSARVDFYLFGFTIDFGSTNKAPDALNLLQFWEMLHKPGPGSTPPQPAADKTSSIQGYLIYRGIDKTGKEVTSLRDLKLPGELKLPESRPEEGAALKFVLEEGNYPMPSPQPSVTASNDPPPNTGAGAKWCVRGGNFKFRVISDFALSHAEIAAPDDGEEVKTTLDASQSIYGRPMRGSNPITSNLSITIRQKDAPFAVIGNWQSVRFAVKPVPLALWGQYSSDLDPMVTANPRELLDGTTVATVPLAMGVMIEAPPPELAPSMIPVFKASSMGKFGIRDFRTDVKNGTDWLLAPTLPIQTVYLAAPLTDAEYALEDAGELNALWEEKQKIWQDAAAAQDTSKTLPDGMMEKVNIVSLMIGQMTSLMGWDTSRPQKEPVLSPPSWSLSSKAPKKLVKNLKNTYLALPRVATVN